MSKIIVNKEVLENTYRELADMVITKAKEAAAKGFTTFLVYYPSEVNYSFFMRIVEKETDNSVSVQAMGARNRGVLELVIKD